MGDRKPGDTSKITNLNNVMNTEMSLRDTATDKVTDFLTQHIINSLTR